MHLKNLIWIKYSWNISNIYAIILCYFSFLKLSGENEHEIKNYRKKVILALLTLTIQFQPCLWNILSSQKSQPKK